MQDPLDNFYKQFQLFVQNNPNVISAARAASQIPESAKAVIVLSPYSLEHSFGRDWVSKSYRKTVVERPERLLASSLGLSAAITMYPALYTLKSSDTHKASLLSPHVLKVHGRDWPPELLRLCKDADAKLAAHEIEVPDSWNAGDIYLSSRTIEALQGSLGALETAVDSLFEGPSPEHVSNRAFVALRPPGHHCHVGTPSGFCLLNNAHVAIEYAKDRYGVTHAAVLDFDLHHGDGTQDICWKRAGFRPDEEDEDSPGYDEFGKKFAEFPRVGYFSMHDINSFPTESGYATKENIKNASTCIMGGHDLNIWNIHLSPWETEEEFQRLYHTKYRTLFMKADEFFKQGKLEMGALNKPFKGLVVISAGFDASEFEQTSMQRHGMNVPTSFYTTFTKDALKLAQMHCHGKVLSVLEGGYSDKALASGVFAHLIGLQNQNWIKEWGSEHVVKEIVRGCKPNWKPYKTKKARDVIRIWAEEVIKLGRAMIPEFRNLFEEPQSTKRLAITQRYTRSQVKAREPAKETVREPAKEKPKDILKEVNPVDKPVIEPLVTPAADEHVRRRIEGIGASETVPFVQEEIPSEDENEDEDYVYDEELNKTFNRTVEDITIDDISRHLETLEIIEPKQESAQTIQNSVQGKYKVPSKTTTQHLRSTRSANPSNLDDSDISMVSHISTRKHTTRSGTKW
ncbi:probable Histone deacetylase HOS3 [Zygosaccharomyces bailii]|nr:probable Histone deacetylase HOS3 [Zygosaccharomyces bailii]